jgi:uroporphyrin-3 C-methyltransferase
LNTLEQELVRRQAASQGLAEAARGTAQQTEEQVRDLAAKLALAEAKLAEVTLQRGQLEDLMSALSRSRDENVVGDLEASLRVASQQAALVGNTEPLLTALRQADERLLRHKQPRLEGVRRALLRDLDRVKAASTVDAATLALRLDEVSRMIDDLPLLNEPTLGKRPQPVTAAKVSAEPEEAGAKWRQWLVLRSDAVWTEVKGLVRVTQIEHPDVMLKTPEQSFFLRENLKLRLLNARLALLSRQFDTARLDLETALRMLERHADRRQRRVQTAIELITQVLAQAKPQPLPKPDESLAALATLGTVR